MITVVSHDTGFRRIAHSQANGGYVVASLHPGLYKITVRKEGFRTLIRFAVKLDVARPLRLDFSLTLGSVREVVTVTGEPPALNTEDAAVGTLIARERIERLPLNGRGLLSLLEFAPGTVVTPATRGESGQFSSSGQRPNANYFLVDGVSANTGVSGGGLPAQTTGGSLPGMTAMGSLHALVSLDALQEFRIQTSTATPEFGRLPGAQVLLSSRSGSNAFHGSLAYYLRTGLLDANNWFDNRHGTGSNDLQLHDIGATFGGPIRRDRTFFFASYEGMRLDEPFAWRSPVPTIEARESSPEWAQPLLNLFPQPNGAQFSPDLAEWSGQYHRNPRFDVASLRIDHSVTSRLTVFGRYSYAPSSNEYTSTQVNYLSLRSQSLTAGASLILTPSVVFDVKVNRSDARSRSEWTAPAGPADSSCYLAPVVRQFVRTGGTCGFLLRAGIAGVGQLNSGIEADQWQDQWQVTPSAVLALGAHQVRLGLDYRHFAPRRNDRAESLSVIAASLNDLVKMRDLWVAKSSPLAVTGSLSEYSAFVQDTWRVHPRLTATFGLRWEFAPAPELATSDDQTNSPAFAYGLPGQSLMWRRSYLNFAPRAGVAYRLSEDDRMVLRAGWGLFYDSSLSISTDLVNGGPFAVTQFSNHRNAPFSTLLSFGFAPRLRFPEVQQWNVAIERGLSSRGDVLTVAYVGSAGRDLLRREFGGYDASETLWLALATNHGVSNYHGLQAQYRRPMAHGLQALASYAWSHSVDNSSSDSVLHWVSPTVLPEQDRGPSDFDVRQALTAAVTWETPRRAGDGFASRVLGGWAIDGIFRARKGFPVNVLNSEYSTLLSLSNAFRPNLVPGQPVWVNAPAAPGGRRLNPAAFETQSGLVQGNLGRNAVRGFGMHQFDFSLRRDFAAGDRHSFQLRLEAFNLFNHPNFADPTRFLSNPLFGESPSTLNFMLGTGSPGSGLTPTLQTGGARSVQIVLRYRF